MSLANFLEPIEIAEPYEEPSAAATVWSEFSHVLELMGALYLNLEI